MLTRFHYNKNEKSLHFPTQAETKNAIIFSYNIWPYFNLSLIVERQGAPGHATF